MAANMACRNASDGFPPAESKARASERPKQETVNFRPDTGGVALPSSANGDIDEGAGDKASSYRERSKTTDGRCDSGHGKSSGSHHEDSLQRFGHCDRDQEGAVLIGGPSPSGEVVAQMPQRQQKSGACFSSISTSRTFCTSLYERNHWHGGGSA